MLNLNVGILGHVDSGKTALAKILSQIASTAAFDKNPQSQARGITLDLGFSSFFIEIPAHLKDQLESNEKIQLTLVDCPGHASLIRCIIGGAQIIDLILLVIDVTKGIQTQTAECLVIGEITCENMIVVLNKIDILDENARIPSIEKTRKRLKQTLKSTKFIDAPIVAVAACPNKDQKPLGIEDLVETISKIAFIPIRNQNAPFLFAIDHCFAIKGKGTVITGTVLQGTAKIDSEISLPAINVIRKIKAMQMFKKSVSSALPGDRLGICVTQFDPKLIERGIACEPGVASFVFCAVISVKRIKYFKGSINTKSKFHVTIGHETSMAIITCFSRKEIATESVGDEFNLGKEYEFKESLDDGSDTNSDVKSYLLLEFEKPVLVTANCTVIGSKLDLDIHKNDCRIAFWGKLLTFSKEKDYKTNYLPNIKIYKDKRKTGVVERLANENTVIVKNLFKKETNLETFVNLKVTLSSGETGLIQGSFGQSGKIKVFFKESLSQATISALNAKSEPISATLAFKKYVYDPCKRILQ